MAVAQDLNFDVVRLLHKFFNKDAVIAKAVAGFVLAGGKAFERFFVVIGHAQALASTAGRGFDHDGVADAFGNIHRFFGRFNGVVVTRNGVDLGFVGQLFRGNFVAHGRNGVGLGADEGNAFFFAALGKGFVFA